MALTATEVRVASDGHIYVAPVDTASPVDVATAPAVAWNELGYASEDGVTLSPGLDTDDINAWQSAVPVRRIVTGSTLEIGFTLLQSNATTLAMYFNATVASDTLTIPVAPTPLEKALLIEWIDGASKYRLYVPRAQLAETGEVNLNRGDAVGFEMTFTALPSATVTGLAKVLMPPSS